MKQERILELLIEASQLGQKKNDDGAISLDDGVRIAQIQNELNSNVCLDRTDKPYAPFRVVVNSIYVDTVRNRPEYLPALFPVFAKLCGDEGDQVVAKIDWSLLPAAPAGEQAKPQHIKRPVRLGWRYEITGAYTENYKMVSSVFREGDVVEVVEIEPNGYIVQHHIDQTSFISSNMMALLKRINEPEG